MKTQRISSQEFEQSLKGFHGTENYYQHMLFNGISILLTDGCHFVRENAGNGAYWLFDLILSWQYKLTQELFQVWRLSKQKDDTWLVQCSDGNEQVLVSQMILSSDFPVDTFEVWLIEGVLVLPTEY
jgi:hypothetical protein